METYRISLDIGGTFTDLVALGEEDSELLNIKVPTNPNNPAAGVYIALLELLREREPKAISLIIHATTIATNALTGQVARALS